MAEAPSTTVAVAGPLRRTESGSSSVMVVVTEPVVTVAELLERETEKVSLISGRVSDVIASEKERS